jgi:hypothetical protein
VDALFDIHRWNTLIKILSLVATLTVALASTLSVAGEIKPYDQATFDALSRVGKPVVVGIQWCVLFLRFSPPARPRKPRSGAVMRRPYER